MNEEPDAESASGGHGDGGGDSSGGNCRSSAANNIENCDRSREDQFADTVRNTLAENGDLAKLQASMRATIMNVMRGGDRSAIVKIKDRNRNPAADMVNRLIMDYLHWCGCEYSIEMFATEAAIADGTDCPDRRAMANAMTAAGLKTDADGLPVLMQLAMRVLCDQRNGK